MLKGLDCSSYQGPSIAWHTVKAAGYSFAFTKGAEGLHEDACFARNWAAMKEVGIIRGAYGFFHPELDPTEQANFFCQVVKTEPGDLPLVADVEMQSGLSPEEYGARLKSYLAVIEADRSQVPIIYCSPGIWNAAVAGDFSRHPLWVAAYSSQPGPRSLPRGWSKFAFWQHSSAGQVPGIVGHVDLDRFNGTSEELRAMTKQPPG